MVIYNDFVEDAGNYSERLQHGLLKEMSGNRRPRHGRRGSNGMSKGNGAGASTLGRRRGSVTGMGRTQS